MLEIIIILQVVVVVVVLPMNDRIFSYSKLFTYRKPLVMLKDRYTKTTMNAGVALTPTDFSSISIDKNSKSIFSNRSST